MKRSALLSTLTLLIGLLVGAAPARAAPPDIADQLRAVPGLTILAEDPPPAAGLRFFHLAVTQPVDHRDPSAGTFEQRMTLLHVGTDRPMVLHTTGYGVPDYAFRSEPTRLVNGNQLSVEQRFFTPSRPEPADWTDLNIWQAATDHHRIVVALQEIYTQKWISTGASKGGMTSIYHRRFYPGDVDGTVAYVAPQDVNEQEDSRYDQFFTRVGTAACRKALDDVQVEALNRRAALVAKYEAWAAANGRTFTIVHGADRAFEFMVNGTTWAFWQYSGLAQCAQVPSVSVSNDALLAWIDQIYGFDSNTDQGITGYVPYYYQAATQLGYPTPKLRHLAKLQHYRGEDEAKSYVPEALAPKFRPNAMDDIDRWVRGSGSELLFVYGQNDPWGAEPFELGSGTRDSLSYIAPGANHGASIAALVPAEAATATAAVQRWAGVTTSSPAAKSESAVDERDPALDRRFSLRG
ncbi:S28 family serine protease [Actinoplanes sp. NPDC049265]|uniref:S28 family serine protease n=1 Tax=Actinoplanes sp. NPDC049265 TaxID=3363902 RepID=UPI003711FB0B